jgi:hypothetical protein
MILYISIPVKVYFVILRWRSMRTVWSLFVILLMLACASHARRRATFLTRFISFSRSCAAAGGGAEAQGRRRRRGEEERVGGGLTLCLVPFKLYEVLLKIDMNRTLVSFSS